MLLRPEVNDCTLLVHHGRQGMPFLSQRRAPTRVFHTHLQSYMFLCMLPPRNSTISTFKD